MIHGKTKDRTVIGGVFGMFDTHGLPLDMVLDQCKAHGLIPSWMQFYLDATNAGWTHDTIIGRLSEAIADVHGEDFRDEVITRLERIACNAGGTE